MRRVIVWIVASIGLFTASAAMASEWWLIDMVGAKPKRMVVFMDKASIRTVRGSVRQVWESWYNESVIPSDPWVTQKVLYEYDCSNRTMSLVSWIRYNRAGESIGSNTVPLYSRVSEPAAPDTLGETALKFACGEAAGFGPITDFDAISSAKEMLLASDGYKSK